MNVIPLCRDQVGFSSSPERRLLALDFNHSGSIGEERLVRGIEIVMPFDATGDEVEAGRIWCIAVHRFYKSVGIDAPIRRGNGIIRSQSSLGIIHTEPFFARDIECRDAIMLNAKQYAFCVYAAFSELSHIHAVYPHLSDDPGAVEDGFSERELAKYLIVPHLQSFIGGQP